MGNDELIIPFKKQQTEQIPPKEENTLSVVFRFPVKDFENDTKKP